MLDHKLNLILKPTVPAEENSFNSPKVPNRYTCNIPSKTEVSYLEHFREESTPNLLTSEIIQSCETGDSMA